MNAVESKKVSVVVQGPVAGAPGDPYERRLTFRCLESIRRHLPGAEIVLSTWQGANVDGLDYDILIANEDPGPIPCLYVDKVEPNNVTRQIVSTGAGLKRASRPYALKIRSDMLLEGNKFLRYFGRFAARTERFKILKQRVLTCTVFSRNARRCGGFPFHPSDWVHFGLCEDVRNIWDVPLAPHPSTSTWFTDPRTGVKELVMSYVVEQHIWLSFLRKHVPIDIGHSQDLSGGIVEDSEISLTNNLVLLTPRQLEMRFAKYTHTLRGLASCYTHGDWRWMYERYCTRSKPATAAYAAYTTLQSGGMSAINTAAAIIHPLKLKWSARAPRSHDLVKRSLNRVMTRILGS